MKIKKDISEQYAKNIRKKKRKEKNKKREEKKKLIWVKKYSSVLQWLWEREV